MKLSEAKTLSRFTLLQIGESGHGKTTRSLSATQYGPVKIIDVDGKLCALRTRIPAEQQDKVDLVVPKSYDEIMAAIIGTNSKEFATLVLDTWSRAHDLTIEKHKASNPKLVQLTLQDWGAIKQLNKQLLAKLMAFPGNVIINTHVGKDRDAMDRQVLTVGTTGSFGSEMPQYFNESHFLYFSGGKFKVRGNRSELIVANTSLPDKYLSPDGHFVSSTLDIFSEVAYKL